MSTTLGKLVLYQLSYHRWTPREPPRACVTCTLPARWFEAEPQRQPAGQSGRCFTGDMRLRWPRRRPAARQVGHVAPGWRAMPSEGGRPAA